MLQGVPTHENLDRSFSAVQLRHDEAFYALGQVMREARPFHLASSEICGTAFPHMPAIFYGEYLRMAPRAFPVMRYRRNIAKSGGRHHES